MLPPHPLAQIPPEPSPAPHLGAAPGSKSSWTPPADSAESWVKLPEGCIPALPPASGPRRQPLSLAEPRPRRGARTSLSDPGPRINVPAAPHGGTWAGPGRAERTHPLPWERPRRPRTAHTGRGALQPPGDFRGRHQLGSECRSAAG